MAAKDDNARPIIIKKKKGGHDEHHGGQWKVAYADFVTAMMAFFLMMWLLNATTEEQRDGIADYFSPTSVSRSTSGGGGMLAGRTVAKDGALVHDRAPMGVNIKLPPAENLDTPNQDGEKAREPSEEDIRRELVEKEKERFEKAAEKLRQAIEASPDLRELKDQLRIDQTPEGLRIQIIDKLNSSMFASGSAKPNPAARKLLARIGQAIVNMPNDVSIKGHTDAIPYSSDSGYTNWELSADRANASRRVLLDAGLQPERLAEVVGRADQDLLLPEDPTNPKNRRISVILLREQPLVPPGDGNRAQGADGTGGVGSQPDGRRIGPSIIERETSG